MKVLVDEEDLAVLIVEYEKGPRDPYEDEARQMKVDGAYARLQEPEPAPVSDDEYDVGEMLNTIAALRTQVEEAVDPAPLLAQRELLRKALQMVLVHDGCILPYAGLGDLDATNDGALLVMVAEDYSMPLQVVPHTEHHGGFEAAARAQMVSTVESGDLLAIARNINNVVMEEFGEALLDVLIVNGDARAVMVRVRQSVNDPLDEFTHDMLKRTVAPIEARAEASSLASIEARNPGIDMDEVKRMRAERGDSHLTSFQAKVLTLEDGTVTPAPGWKWCPVCNGEGEITTMDSGPDLGEQTRPCGTCIDGLVADGDNVTGILHPLREQAESSEYVHDARCLSPAYHEGSCPLPPPDIGNPAYI